MSSIKVLIADDQTLLRDGLKTIFELEHDMEVVGVAEDGEQTLQLFREFNPDVVLLDIQMPVMNGIECLRQIRHDSRETKVIMLTTFDEENYIIEAMANGATGFLVKDMQGDQLIDSVRNAAKNGQIILPGTVASKLISGLSQSLHKASAQINLQHAKERQLHFSERETEIIQLMLQGCNTRKISASLHIGEGTVRNYISVIYQKIGLNDRTEAIRYLNELFVDEMREPPQ